MIKLNEHPNQFNVVANGTTLAGIISGTYIHTTGPIVVLNIVIYNISIPNTIQNAPGNLDINTNNIPNTISHIPNPKFPVNIIVFLPRSFNDNNDPNVAANWTKFMINGV